MATFYELLGVSKTAGTADIRKAYAALAREKHPDRFTDPAAKAAAQQTFQDLNNANGAQPATPPIAFQPSPNQPNTQVMPGQPAPAQRPATASPSVGSRRPGQIAPAPNPTPSSDR